MNVGFSVSGAGLDNWAHFLRWDLIFMLLICILVYNITMLCVLFNCSDLMMFIYVLVSRNKENLYSKQKDNDTFN